MVDAKQEIKEVLDDAKKIQDILSKFKINNKEYMHSIPVLLSEFYPNTQDLIGMFELLAKQSVILHKMMYKK
jgi:hypothetical protein